MFYELRVFKEILVVYNTLGYQKYFKHVSLILMDQCLSFQSKKFLGNVS